MQATRAASSALASQTQLSFSPGRISRPRGFTDFCHHSLVVATAAFQHSATKLFQSPLNSWGPWNTVPQSSCQGIP